MTEQRLPAIFFGHGSPMNALEKNLFTNVWEAFGREIPRPRAVLAVSAHWETRATHVTAMPRPKTIHDFGNFPPELHRFQYPAPGDPKLAAEVRGLLRPTGVAFDLESWGLDHGVWSVLCHVFPNADVPVVELSIDQRLTPVQQYELGHRLSALRDESVLIMGSGNVVHNLAYMRWGPNAEPQPWAIEYEARVRDALEAGDVRSLIEYDTLTPEAHLAAPDIEHYIPLLYVLAVRSKNEPVSFPTAGIVGGAISMLSVRFG